MKHSSQLIVAYTTLLPCFVIGPPLSSALNDLVDVITFATIDGFKRNILLTQVEDKHFITLASILSLQKNSLQAFLLREKHY
jgi:hypothetical protein